MSASSPRIAVFASGRGSNLHALIDAIRQGSLQATLCAVVSDQPGAAALEKARAAGIEALGIPPKNDREQHEREISERLKEFSPRFIVLAGYMRIFSPWMIEQFRSERGYSRIANIHPSLLPAFPGKNAYSQAFSAGVKVTGATVHWVESAVDSGPICAQEAFSIEDCGSVEEVEARGLKLEHQLYPKALNWMLREQFQVERKEGVLRVRSN